VRARILLQSPDFDDRAHDDQTMRSRRINIEGNRYLVFYTFADEPWLGAAATADAGAQHSTQPNDTNTPTVARLNDAPNVSASDKADRSGARPHQVSTDELIDAPSKSRDEEKRSV
jgi:hypothetical protein